MKLADLVGRRMQLWTADRWSHAYYESARCLHADNRGMLVEYCAGVAWVKKPGDRQERPYPDMKIDAVSAPSIKKLRLLAE